MSKDVAVTAEPPKKQPKYTAEEIEIAAYEAKTAFGFWVYLMTDLVLFATLFATFAVMRNNTAGGPSGAELFSLPFVLVETLLLLTSSFTSGLAMIAVRRRDLMWTYILFAATFALGVAFLGMELHEFNHLASEGNSWQRSGFLSAFFTLVGTHGLHITAGLIWMFTLLWQMGSKELTKVMTKRLQLLSMFWHFLDLVWIFIFTIVYLMGVVQL